LFCQHGSGDINSAYVHSSLDSLLLNRHGKAVDVILSKHVQSEDFPKNVVKSYDFGTVKSVLSTNSNGRQTFYCKDLLGIITEKIKLSRLTLALVDIYNMKTFHHQQMHYCVVASNNFPGVFNFDDDYMSYLTPKTQKQIISSFLYKKIMFRIVKYLKKGYTFDNLHISWSTSFKLQIRRLFPVEQPQSAEMQRSILQQYKF
jgi:hypothetical protein